MSAEQLATYNEGQRLETGRKQKLEYGYFIVNQEKTAREEQVAGLMFGTALRGLGYDWRIGLVPSENTHDVFVKLQNSLSDPSRIVISNFSFQTNPNVIIVDDVDPQKTAEIRKNASGKSHVIIAGGQTFDNSLDLISYCRRLEVNDKGVLAITGDGKGKTTMAMGLALESALLTGQPSAVVQWFKDKSWGISEHKFSSLLRDPELFQIYPMGAGFFSGTKLDSVKGENAAEIHAECAKSGSDFARKLIAGKNLGTVVLDEFIDTREEVSGNISESLLTLDDVRGILEMPTSARVIVTGRKVTDSFGDLVGRNTVIRNIRHPYTNPKDGKQQYALRGLDY